jgi:plastocyanin
MKTAFILCVLMVSVIGTSAFATTWTVDVHNFAFDPAALTIFQGDTVHWHASNGTHSVHHVGSPSLFGSAIAAAPWDYSFAFNIGDSTFHYICQVHPTLMMGTITVLPLPTITITSPNGNEHWDVGSSHDIMWNSTNFNANVTIELNRDYPSGTWDTLFTHLPNPPYYGWTVTGPGSDHCRIRVSGESAPYVSDISDADFRIIMGTITITAPVGGEDWAIGSQQYITWQSSNIQHELNLDLNRDYPNGPWERIYAFFPNLEQIGWIVTGPPSTHCRFRVSSWFVPEVAGESAADFTISAPTITVTAPNGGETWTLGSAQSVTWSSEHLTGTNVVIEVNYDFPAGGWTQISGLVPNTGSFSWTVAGTASTHCRVGIWSYETNVRDESDSNFTIQTLPAPLGLVIHPQGSDIILTWQATPGATSYGLYRSTDPTVPVFTELVGNTIATTLTDLGVVAGNTKYFYQVRAVIN